MMIASVATPGPSFRIPRLYSASPPGSTFSGPAFFTETSAVLHATWVETSVALLFRSGSGVLPPKENPRALSSPPHLALSLTSYTIENSSLLPASIPGTGHITTLPPANDLQRLSTDLKLRPPGAIKYAVLSPA